MKRTTMMAVLLLIMAGTAVGQVRPFVKAGIGTSEYWLQNAEGTDMRFSYAVGAGALIGSGNSTLTQGFAHGFGNIDWGYVADSSILGGVTSYFSAETGSYVTSVAGNWFSSIGNVTKKLQTNMGWI